MIVFHHIPKTAGSTFLTILKKQYTGKRILKIDPMNPKESIDYFKALPIYERNSFDLIMGHLADKCLTDLVMPFRKIIFVRNPDDHFISTFHYIKRSQQNRYFDVVSKMHSIEEYLDFRRMERLDNLQTKHALGLTEFLMDENKEKPALDNFNIENKLDRLVKDTAFLFPMEEFDPALLILHQELDWNKYPYYRSKNVTKGSSKIDQYPSSTIESIRSFNTYDWVFYNKARVIFNEKYHKIALGDFKSKLRKFRNRNRIFRHLSL